MAKKLDLTKSVYELTQEWGLVLPRSQRNRYFTLRERL